MAIGQEMTRATKDDAGESPDAPGSARSVSGDRTDTDAGSHDASCVVCGCVSERVVWRENGYEARSCECGALYTAPFPAPHAIDLTLDAHTDDFYRLPARLKVRWLSRNGRGGSLLEIGCGEGHFLEAAQRAGFRVSGLEIDPARARRAAARLTVPITCGRIEDVEIPGAAFDVVYHCDLLSHFPDPLLALARMKNLLCNEGVLAFEVGLVADIATFWHELSGTLDLPQHRWFYSERSLAALLRKAGFTIVESKHFGLAPQVLMRRVAGFAGRFVSRGGASSESRSSGHALDGAYARLDAFVRYRIGAFAPRIGPATLFVLARPV